MVKNLPAKQETWVRSLGREDPLEKGTATHSSILAWEVPWTEQPGGRQSTGSQRWTRVSDRGRTAWSLYSVVQKHFVTEVSSCPLHALISTHPKCLLFNNASPLIAYQLSILGMQLTKWSSSRQWNSEWKQTSQIAGLESDLCQVPRVWPCASHLISLCTSSFYSKMKIRVVMLIHVVDLWWGLTKRKCKVLSTVHAIKGFTIANYDCDYNILKEKKSRFSDLEGFFLRKFFQNFLKFWRKNKQFRNSSLEHF